jgi:uncharacterized membrane protein (DUF441 family)
MASDPISQARRRAKALSRGGVHTYQQALDVIAREEGHSTWKDMLSRHVAEPDADAVVTRRHSGGIPVQAPVSWRLRELERIEGSRHHAFDERAIRLVGGPLARLIRRAGLPIVASIVALAVMVPLFAGLLVGEPVFDVGMAFVVALLAPVFVIGTLRSPDHRGARRMRRSARVLTVFVLMLGLAVGFMSHVRFGDGLIDAWMDTARLSLFSGSLCFAMWIAAWEGRRLRREKDGIRETATWSAASHRSGIGV